jgi:hypothetical protein
MALVHRDDPEIGGELFPGIERDEAPGGDLRSDAAGRQQQQRVSGSILLKVNRSFVIAKQRHLRQFNPGPDQRQIYSSDWKKMRSRAQFPGHRGGQFLPAQSKDSDPFRKQ